MGVFNLVELFVVPIKNDVIQYKWPMIGNNTDLITNGMPVYILIDQWQASMASFL